MLVLLPYPSFPLTAHALDPRRLGQQMAGAVGILRTLAGDPKRARTHRAHPAVVMWEAHPVSLACHAGYLAREIERRGIVARTLSPRTEEGCTEYRLPLTWATDVPVSPPWLGHPPLHASHRAFLLRCDRWYMQMAWTEREEDWPLWTPLPMPLVGDVVARGDRELLVVEVDAAQAVCLDRSRSTVVLSAREIMTDGWISQGGDEWRY